MIQELVIKKFVSTKLVKYISNFIKIDIFRDLFLLGKIYRVLFI